MTKTTTTCPRSEARCRHLASWAERWPRFLEEVHLPVTELPAGEAPLPPDEVRRRYDSNQQQLAAAALWLHPLLGEAARRALASCLRWSEPEALAELGADTDGDLHLLRAGRVKLVAVSRSPAGTIERREIGHALEGQWIGMAGLLRADAQRRANTQPWLHPDAFRLEIEILEPVRAQTVARADALALLEHFPDFRRYVEHHVAARFARRYELLDCMADNALLRLLPPTDRDYLLGIGALKRSGAEELRYLRAGVPAGRVALLVRGEATAWLPPSGKSPAQWVGRFPAGSLLGVEGLVMPGETCDATPGAMNIRIAEPPRPTEIWLAPDSEVLEFSWHGVRWTLDGCQPVWDRVIRTLRGEVHCTTAPAPSLITVLGAKPEVGVSVIGHGLGAALACPVAPAAPDQTDQTAAPAPHVWVVDLQGEAHFAAWWQKAGFRCRQETARLRRDLDRRRGATREETLAYCRLVPPEPPRGWPGNLHVAWLPRTARDEQTLRELMRQVDQLVTYLQGQEGVRHVVICGQMLVPPDAARAPAPPPNGAARGSGLGEAVSYLAYRSTLSFYVTDDAGQEYNLADEEPENLVWVYRMNAGYLERERQRAKMALWESLFGRVPPPLRRLYERRYGRALDRQRREELEGRRRRAVRIPEDASGTELLQAGRIADFLARAGRANTPPYTLAQACQRLARVVEGRSVGLALGGGGAWGFAHVPLIEQLAARDVPIDYIAGTSFGSVIGGAFASRGLEGLRSLVRSHSAPSWVAGLASPLQLTLLGWTLLALGSPSAALYWLVRRMDALLAAPDAAPLLGAAELVFCPVATDLALLDEVHEMRASPGWGVALSGGLPPLLPGMRLGGASFVDGAFVANVPSRVVRDMGASFVISCNVVPPQPSAAAQPAGWGEDLGFWPFGQLRERLSNSIRCLYLLASTAGADQGALAADVAVSLSPEGAECWEMWKGDQICASVRERAAREAELIERRWARLRQTLDAPRSLVEPAPQEERQ